MMPTSIREFVLAAVSRKVPYFVNSCRDAALKTRLFRGLFRWQSEAFEGPPVWLSTTNPKF